MPIYEGSCRLTFLERQEVWNDYRSYKVRVGSNVETLKFAAMPFGLTNAPAVFMELMNDHRDTEGREDVHEVFQQRGSGVKRKLSRCGRNQMGNEPIVALPEGADDFVVYYDARSKDLEACLEKKGEGDCLHVATTEEVKLPSLSEWYDAEWSREKSNETETKIHSFIDSLSMLLGQVGITVDNHGLAGCWEIGNQSIECDHLNEIGLMVEFVEFISFTFEDDGEMSI
ncbi:hypothetical protein Tco_0510902 [Tanacetum coccineum]